LRLDGKLVLIVGGGEGLGSADAVRLASAGAQLAVTDIDLDTAQRIAGVLAIRVDVTSRASVRDVFTSAQLSLGGLDVLIYGVGIARRTSGAGLPVPRAFESASFKDLDHVACGKPIYN
jgi:NAD(P)-dependent dehydrogenase (short-subunit alcohol dehydrogenase family)